MTIEAASREHLPKNHAERELIGATVEFTGLDLLGRHVQHFSLECAKPSATRAIRDLRDSEIDDLRDAINANHDVLWTDVAMNETEPGAIAVTGLMRVIETERSFSSDHRRRRNG